MANVKDAAAIAGFFFPPERHTVVWLFDLSSCHRAFSENALNARRMNARPGGAQPCMRDTVWVGRIQTMVDENGVQKKHEVLEERGINTTRMNADDMRVVFANHEDFRTEKLCNRLLREPTKRLIPNVKTFDSINSIARMLR